MNFWLLSRRQCSRSIISFSRSAHTQSRPLKKFGFAIGTEGTLTKGSAALPKAKEALTKISDAAAPFILFSNGGETTEPVKASNLTTALSHPINVGQLFQSHLPFKLRAKDYETILAVGGNGEACRRVAEDYGFKNVIIPEDFYATDPTVSPCTTGPPAAHARPIPEGTKIDAIFVFSDPCDWALSIQVIVDTLLSEDGKVGTRLNSDEGVKPHVPFFFASPDQLVSDAHPFPRLAQGGFQRALFGTYSGFKHDWYTTPNYRAGFLGKLSPVTLRIAERMVVQLAEKDGESALNPIDWPLGGPTSYPNLRREARERADRLAAAKAAEANGEGKEAGGEAKELAGEGKEGDGEGEEVAEEGGEAEETVAEAEDTAEEAEITGRDPTFKDYEKAMKRIYLIGDKPRSDVMGANTFKSKRGIEWISILVRTGVFKGGVNHGAPRAIVDDVSAAVDWALENERRIENNEPLEEGPFHLSAAKKKTYLENRKSPRTKKPEESEESGESEGSKEPEASEKPKEPKVSEESKKPKVADKSKKPKASEKPKKPAESKAPKPEKKEKAKGAAES